MHTILITEADPKIADLLKTQIEKRGYEVMLASTMEECQSVLHASIPDIILIDLNTADENFFKYYNTICNDLTIGKVQRLFIEGSHKEALGAKLRQEFGESIIKKPLRISQLLSEVNRLMGHSQMSLASTGQSIPVTGMDLGQAPATSSLPQEEDKETTTQRKLAAFLGRQIGNVVLQREIGRGGMGAVFIGQQTTLERDVAVKVMLPDLVGDNNALVRFRREALAIARLKSPHIVQVFDAGSTEDNVFYIVMEFLEGGTVDDHLKMNTRCAVDEAVDVMIQVASGLEVAHNAGLIHRDLKPSNLMINASGHVTITDFGLVREHGIEQGEQLTRQGSLLGTPYYLSPEQASAAKLDPRTDLYSLGIIGYELLTGEVPFTSNNLLDILVMHHNLPLPDPRKKIKVGIPEALVQILMRLAAKKADERYPHAGALLQDLRALKANLPVGGGQIGIPHVSASVAPISTNHPNFSLTTSSGQRLSEYAARSELSIAREDAEGKAMLRASGEIFERQGVFPDAWIRALSISVGVIQQLQTLPGLGTWQFAHIETIKRILHIHPHGELYEAVLLQSNNRMASMSLQMQAPAPPLQTQSDPFLHISSIAGVQGLLMFNQHGQLQRQHYNTMMDEELIRVRLAPLPQLLQSVPINMIGIDTTYDQGRVFVWDMDDQMLFVIANASVNKAILTSALSSQLALFTSKKQTPNTISASVYPDLPADVTASPALMKEIKQAYSRSIGPIADLTMKKEAKKMGFSRKSFPRDKLEEYVTRLGAQLDTSKQQEFIDKALSIIEKDQ